MDRGAHDDDRPTDAETARTRAMRELRELIAALDRRVPQVQRLGELSIARAAADLRDAAVKRLDQLDRDATGDEPRTGNPLTRGAGVFETGAGHGTD